MHKKKILVVDDDVLILTLIKRDLESTGRYTVETLDDARKAVQMVKSFEPNLVILDVMMPHMDGGMVAAALRNDARTKDIAIIFLTGIMSKEEAAARRGTRDCYMAKPTPMKELMDRIEELTA